MRSRIVLFGLAFAGTLVPCAVSVAEERPFPNLLPVTVTATSTLISGKKTYDAWRVLGNVWGEFWCEGKPDEGIGEALTVQFPKPTKVDTISIRPGVQKSDALFKANNVVTGLSVTTDDGRSKEVTFPGKFSQERAEVEIGGSPVKQLTLKITKVRRGRMNDSCISEVSIATNPGSVVLIGVEPAQAATLQPIFDGTLRAIAACDPKLLAAQARFPLPYGVVDNDDIAYTKYKDVPALIRDCKEHKFSDFGKLQGEAKVKMEGSGKVSILDEVTLMEWDFAFDHGSWKLVKLVDQTP
jgi:hypothetical protein